MNGGTLEKFAITVCAKKFRKDSFAKLDYNFLARKARKRLRRSYRSNKHFKPLTAADLDWS